MGRHGNDDLGAQALHGLTFALRHMVAMHIIATSIPQRLATTAQSLYGTLVFGAASEAMTFASGYLYGWLGMQAFWAMGALCALSLPFVRGIGSSEKRPHSSVAENEPSPRIARTKVKSF
jgi:PPP family 3-phenylpropionic acid transporter